MTISNADSGPCQEQSQRFPSLYYTRTRIYILPYTPPSPLVDKPCGYCGQRAKSCDDSLPAAARPKSTERPLWKRVREPQPISRANEDSREKRKGKERGRRNAGRRGKGRGGRERPHQGRPRHWPGLQTGLSYSCAIREHLWVALRSAVSRARSARAHAGLWPRHHVPSLSSGHFF